MRSLLAAGTVIAAAVTGAVAQDCSKDPLGNSYCEEVTNLIFENVAFDGEYFDITKIDETTGTCTSAPKQFSGGLGPLNEEVSVQFRGPLHLKEFAVLIPGSENEKSKSKEKRHSSHRRHAHQRFHKRSKEIAELQKRECGAKVTQVIDGVETSWANPVGCDSASVAATETQGDDDREEFTPLDAVGGNWTRVAYYNAEDSTAEGLTFLTNLGGQYSGVFTYTFGNSLAYASSDLKSGAKSPQILDDALVPSNTEFTILSDKKCKEGSCGYTREGGVAYHGWTGSRKAFCAELQMPLDGKTGFNGDMPAWWILNANIPRTLQYPNKPECSCWKSGCGEFDVMEVLASGDKRCTSTLHSTKSKGSPDYLPRPTDKFVKVCTVMYDDRISTQILDDSVEFASIMSEDTMLDILSPDTDPNVSVQSIA